jgi:hypothetical protein
MQAESLKAIVESSNAMSSWGLTLIGASVVAIVSTSNLRPTSKRERLPYLLFLLGWLCLGVSMSYGFRLSGNHVAAQLVDPDRLPAILELMNTRFLRQQTWFMAGLVPFGVWLAFFLFWWVFVDHPREKA